MMKPHYPIPARNSLAVMAEQNPDGTWNVEGIDFTRPDVPDEAFRKMYTDEAPHEYKKHGTDETINPVALAEAGTHRLEYITDKQQLHKVEEEHPDAWFLNLRFGDIPQLGTQQAKVLPFNWTSWHGSKLPIIHEEHANYFFPILAVIPNN